MSLQFGSITFADPIKLAQWRPASGAGLYCICVINKEWKPVPYQPIFFGVTGNFVERDMSCEQVALESWSAHASSPTKLLVAHVDLPHFSSDQLELFEQQLIARYEPPCNNWKRLPEFTLPMQRRNGVLAMNDDPSSIATQSDLEEMYA
jgi:hypothetical protein